METPKMRIIQELVPGKQITLAHVIANPDSSLYNHFKYESLSGNSAFGIITITPPETSIIIADVSVKISDVQIVSLNRTSGSLIITGTVANVETAVRAVLEYVDEKLGFEVCGLTKT